MLKMKFIVKVAAKIVGLAFIFSLLTQIVLNLTIQYGGYNNLDHKNNCIEINIKGVIYHVSYLQYNVFNISKYTLFLTAGFLILYGIVVKLNIRNTDV